MNKQRIYVYQLWKGKLYEYEGVMDLIADEGKVSFYVPGEARELHRIISAQPDEVFNRCVWYPKPNKQRAIKQLMAWTKKKAEGHQKKYLEKRDIYFYLKDELKKEKMHEDACKKLEKMGETIADGMQKGVSELRNSSKKLGL